MSGLFLSPSHVAFQPMYSSGRMRFEPMHSVAAALGIPMLKSCSRFFLLIALAALIGSCSRPNPGLLELQRSREAVRAARSWQYGTTVQLPTGPWVVLLLTSVECPGRIDRAVMMHDAQNSSVHEISFDGTYYSQSGGSAWSSKPAPSPKAVNCGQGPSLVWDGILYDDLDAIQRTGEIRRGATAKADDVSCVWWEVAPSRGAPPHYSVCVGEGDHLPRIVRSRERDTNYVYSFTRWNTTTVSLPAGLTLPKK